MDFKDRKEIILFLQDCEKKYQVKDWQIDGLHIWPLLKTTIFFKFINSLREKNTSLPKRRFSLIFLKSKSLLSSIYYTYKLNFKKVDYLFTGAINYRQTYKGNSMNKFFDPLMDYIEEQQLGSSKLFDYYGIEANKYKSNRVVGLVNLYPYFKFKENKKITAINELGNDFHQLLDELATQFNVEKKTLLFEINNQFKATKAWEKIWLRVLTKTQPKIAFGLCYYVPAMYGMNIACQELNIPAVDMMHGLQGPLHPCYNIKEFPENGYALMPDYFWLWEEDSYANLKPCLHKQCKHQAFIGGNPWHLFLKNEASKDTLSRKKIILYTLQTTLEPVVNDFILQAIKETKEDFQWWLRFHPRMTKEEIDLIYTSLANNNLLHKVEIKQANALALPLLLVNCEVHISKFSGSIAEAAMIGGCLNIIIDEIGKESYENLIEQEKAVFYNQHKDGQLMNFVNSYLSHTDKNLNDVQHFNYSSFIKKIEEKSTL